MGMANPMPELWSAPFGGDHGVDADHLAARVQQRPAGVAGIDGRVGLDGVFDRRAIRVANRADGADNAAGHGPAQAEWIADGVDLLAHGKFEESASVTGCRLGASICSSARSCTLSVPTTLAA